MKTRLPAALLSLALSSPLLSQEAVPPPLLEFASGLPGKQVLLTWPAAAGIRYRIERSTELGAWTQVAIVEASGAEGSWRDPETTKTQAFYRITQPEAEVFSIPEPVLTPTGGELLIHGQLIPAGSKLVLLVEGVEMEFDLVSMGGGIWRASVVGGFLPGGSVISAAVNGPSGQMLVSMAQPIEITLSGRAGDSPPSLPPAAPYPAAFLSKKGYDYYQAQSALSSAFLSKKGYNYYQAQSSLSSAFLSKKGYDYYQAQSSLSSAFLSKKGYDYYQAQSSLGSAFLSKRGYDYYKAQSDMASTGAQTNPAFHAPGHAGEMPPVAAGLVPGTSAVAINQKGTGADKNRVIPASSGLPGEVSFQHVSLDLPCPAGPPLAWVCTYRSKHPVQSGLGAGWDFSYNISIEPMPLAAGSNAPRVLVRDGGGRADVFHRQPDGSYRCDGMFREGSFRNGVFTLTFANAGRWVFRPLDGSPGAGKISSIVDRNDVALTCNYDSSGQLSWVKDSYDRRLAVEWSPTSSHIVSVTAQDGTGTVSYQKIEFDYIAASSRLATISSPHVPGLPPVAGPLSFTYSEGLSDPNLNGNLLSLHDGAGRLLEGFEYSLSTDPADPAYDTCAAHDRHRTGGAGHQLRTTFAVLLGGGSEACENDELGRVTVTTFDKLHRIVRERLYTGFATPGVPVTSSSLPSPATKLRATDPNYFETSCAYNADSLCTRITHPDGSREMTVYDRDFRKGCPVRERGNARMVSLVASGGEARTVTCNHLPGYGAPEPACSPGNPIGGLTIKGGKNPGGGSSKLIWSPRSNFTFDGTDDDETPSANMKINDGMPNRISMNVTVPKQTQGATFGEKVRAPRDSSSGLATGRRRSSGGGGSGGCGGDVSYIGTCDASDARLSYVGPCDASADGYIGTCDASFPTRIVTAHGQAFESSYDTHGNLTLATGPIEGSGTQFEYNARGQVTSTTVLDGPDSSFHTTVAYGADGFPSGVTVDPEGLAISTGFDHDDLGRVISVTDPLGHSWSYGYDSSSNLVSITSPPAPTPIVTTATVDAGGQIVRVDTAHLGADGQPVAENPAYSTFFVRDSRCRLVRVAEEERPVDASGVTVPDSLGLENFAVTDITRDDAGQIVRLSTPAACRGQAVDLVCEFTYDERGLSHRVIQGGASAALPVITETDYDASGAPIRLAGVASGLPSPVTLLTWDGFHRLSSVTDPMGNVASLAYDNQGFVTTSILGEVEDQLGSDGNVLLYRAFNQNSSRSNNGATRAYNQNNARSNHTRWGLSAELFFDVFCPDDTLIEERFAAGAAGQPALETTVVHRSPAGLPLSVTCNGDSLLTLDYDSAGRLSLCADGATTTALTRDKNGNVLVCGDTDHFLVAGVPDKTFTMTRSYDALGRCTSLTDGIGNSVSFAFDSLGRCVSTTEPGGLVVTTAYDGGSGAGAFSQRTSADVDGDGQPEPLSSSLIRCGETLHLADSYGHLTTFTCDALGRVTRCDYPDATYEQTTYDALGRATAYQRKNGAIIACDFNRRGQLVSMSHDQLPEEVVPVAATIFTYNGLGDCVRCVQGTSVIEWTWDSLGNALGESQNGRTITRSFNHRGRTGITYPDGRRFGETRDPLGRLLSLSALSAAGTPLSPPVVVLEYAGDRVWRSTQANGVVTAFSYRGDGPTAPPGSPDFSFDACVETSVMGLAAHELAHVVQQRDRNQRLTSRQTLFTETAQGPGRMQTFTRDGMGRLTGYITRRRELQGAPPIIEDSVTYILGKEGRRIQELRNGVTGDYTQDTALPPGDQQMDQYTTWPGGPLDWDEEGNLRSIHRSSSIHACTYDAEGRLVSVTDPAAGSTLVSYTYDAVGRRISRSSGGSGLPMVTTEFVYDGSECIQEWGDDGTGTGTIDAAVTFASSGGIKHCISTRDGTIYYPVANATAARSYGGRTCSCPNGYYYSAAKNKVEHWGDPHENLNGFALVTNSAAVVTERFDCDDAGKPVFLSSAGVPSGSSSAIGPIRWMAPEAMWEPSIGMFLGADALYCPELGMTVARGNGHVTVLKSAAQDHNSSRSNKSSSAAAQDHNSSRSNRTSS